MKTMELGVTYDLYVDYQRIVSGIEHEHAMIASMTEAPIHPDTRADLLTSNYRHLDEKMAAKRQILHAAEVSIDFVREHGLI